MPKTVFQSFLILTTVKPYFFAASSDALSWGLPTLSGRSVTYTTAPLVLFMSVISGRSAVRFASSATPMLSGAATE